MITVSAKGAFTIAEAMIAQGHRMAFAMKCFRYIATSRVCQSQHIRALPLPLGVAREESLERSGAVDKPIIHTEHDRAKKKPR